MLPVHSLTHLPFKMYAKSNTFTYWENSMLTTIQIFTNWQYLQDHIIHNTILLDNKQYDMWYNHKKWTRYEAEIVLWNHLTCAATFTPMHTHRGWQCQMKIPWISQRATVLITCTLGHRPTVSALCQAESQCQLRWTVPAIQNNQHMS